MQTIGQAQDLPLQNEYPVLMASKLDKEELAQILEETKELVKIIMEKVEK